MAGPGADASPGGELARLRVENEALSAVVGLVASSPDLGHVLDRVVDLLTRVSGCHACFVYLVAGDQLELRAASPVYSRHVGHIGFSVDDGLAGWAVRHRQAAFIGDQAMDDPRTNFVPELEETRFQSMAAIPVAARSGDILGVIVLHTAAPHEFEEGILNVLTQTASVIAGAIENAKLYDEARQRVAALTRLSTLSQGIAAVTRRAELYEVATAGVCALLPCDHCRLLELDGSGRMVVVAEHPAGTGETNGFDGTAEVLLELLRSSGPQALRLRTVVGRALGTDKPPKAALAVPVAAGDELLGALVVGSAEPWQEHGDELLRATAHQVAVALKQAELIESLSEENVARELFDALEHERWEVAAARARTLGCDLDLPHVVVEGRPLTPGGFESEAEVRLERVLRQTRPGTVCDADGGRVRALVPAPSSDAEGARQAAEGLSTVARENGVILGCSAAKRGAASTRDALAEAHDAARIAVELLDDGGALLYDEMGAYRYLVTLLNSDGPRDNLREAVESLARYDSERKTQLLLTLETFLANGQSSITTAKALTVHVNTLRQRLDRIEALTGLDLGSQDLLALHIAIKLVHLRRPSHP
jgi:GAF domain-containing protein